MDSFTRVICTVWKPSSWPIEKVQRSYLVAKMILNSLLSREFSTLWQRMSPFSIRWPPASFGRCRNCRLGNCTEHFTLLSFPQQGGEKEVKEEDKNGIKIKAEEEKNCTQPSQCFVKLHSVVDAIYNIMCALRNKIGNKVDWNKHTAFVFPVLVELMIMMHE